MSDSDRIERALEYAAQYGATDGGHHKTWVIDQMVRALTGCPVTELASKFPDARGNAYTYQGQGESEAYREFVATQSEWDEGIAP